MAFSLRKATTELAQAVPPLTPATELSASSEQELLEAERLLREGSVRVRDIIAPASLKITPDHIELNGLWLRTLFVMTYPRYISDRKSVV